jgi:hypothetical protein
MDPNASPSDKSERLEMARMRQQLASRLILFSFGLIALLLVAAAMIALAAWQAKATNGVWATQIQTMLNTMLTAVLPLLGAWVGAIITFYFSRETYEAAAQNVHQAMQTGGQGTDLKTILAKDIMIGEKGLTYINTPSYDAKLLDSDILPQFKDRGRIVILRDPDNTGLGVVHDGNVKGFLADKGKTGTDINTITLKHLLDDKDLRTLLDSSVIYVSPTTTLADVKQRMEEASKNRPIAVRDAFVTTSGDSKEKVIGYVTDIDIAKRGAFK